MIRLLCGIAVLALYASPSFAADVYGSMTMTKLGSVLTDERGVPVEVKNVGGQDVVLVDGSAYQISGKIQLTGLLCNNAAPPSCGGYAIAGTIPVPAGAISDAQLLSLASKFDFVAVDRLDATRLALTMAAVTQGGVTAENIDNHLRFFAGQIQLVTAEVQKLLPPPAKGK